MYLDLGVVGYGDLPVLRRRHNDFKDSKVILLHWVGIAVPTIYVKSAHDDVSSRAQADSLKSPMRNACWALGAHSR